MQATEETTLRSAPPRWEAAAQRLVSALAAQSDASARCRLLERIAHRFGRAHYLSFVQLLCAVEQFGDLSARQTVAQALAGALQSGRMPAGVVPAWGASGPGLGGIRPGPSAWGLASGRSLGPIEFVCAALLQPGVTPAATPPQAGFALRRLIALLNSSAQAQTLYIAQLRAAASQTLEGGLSQRTCTTLATLASAWEAGESPDQVVARALAAAHAPPR